MNTSSHARILICFAPENASHVCETLASLASKNSTEIAAIRFAIQRLIGIRIIANITPETKATPICVYSRYNAPNS